MRRYVINIVLILLSSLIVISCTRTVSEDQLEEYSETLYKIGEDTPYSGKIISTYENGQKLLEGKAVDGKRVGTWLFWDYNGLKKKEEVYNKDGEILLSTIYHENGIKKFEEEYKHEKLDGLRTFWYKNGQKMNEVHFQNGKKEGLSTTWYEGGQKRSETNYSNGEKDGMEISWHEDGQIKERKIFKDGKEGI
jgi:antitoxin component YwqK of YwqJK toxin-antitoxin module